MSNYVITTVCFLMQIGFVILINDNEVINKRVRQRYLILTGLLFLELILDNFAIYFNGYSPAWVIPLKIIKALQFTIATCLPMLISNIIVRKRFWEHFKYIFVVIICINGLLQFASIFTGWTFVVDENAVYSPAFGTWIYSGLLVIELFLVVVSSVKTYVQNFNKFNSIIYIVFFIIAGFLLRVWHREYSVDSLFLSAALYMFMMHFQNSFFKIDIMTALLNQTTYFSRIAQVHYNTVIILIDMNNFKYVNDTYGHKKGDDVLRMVGEIILDVYGDIAYCYRRGGDEFAVIFKPNVLEKLSKVENSNIYDEVRKYMKRLYDRIGRESRKHRDIIKDNVAQGFGIYYTYNEVFNKGEYKEFKDVIEIADKRMFENKKSIKEGNPIF